MDTGLTYSASEQKRIKKLFQPVSQFEKSKKGTASLEEVYQLGVAILLDELEKNKEDAFLWSLLAEHFEVLKENGKALDACKKAYELEPNNPRTVFNMASCYNALARAGMIGHPKYDVLAKYGAKYGEFGPFSDPHNSKKRLQELGMSQEEAADKSWSLFYQVLNMGIKYKEREHVLETAGNLRKIYPYLEVPKSYKSPKSASSNPLAWIAAIIFVFFFFYLMWTTF